VPLGSMEHSSISGWQPSSNDLATPRVPRREGWRWTLLLLMASSASAQTGALGLRNDVVFTEYSPLSSVVELVRRLRSPLSALRLNQDAERAGRTLRGQPIDLVKERYSIFVPNAPHSPSGTYCLLVFIPPWPRAEVPRAWIPVLNRYNTI